MKINSSERKIIMLNKLCCIGRMTKDPELRRTAQGTAVTSFTLACNRTFKSADGQEADFIPCVIWNKGAENVERYCSKGSLIAIEARMQSRSYDNSHGQKVFVLEAICESVQFLDNKNKENKAPEQQNVMNPYDYMGKQQQSAQNNFNGSNNSFDISEDDIQF